MRTLVVASVLSLLSVPALSAELTTRGGELICFKLDDLRTFVAMIRDRGPSAAQAKPGCIAAKPGLVLTNRGPAGQIEGVGPVTRIRAVSPSNRRYFDGFTTARF